MKYWNNKNQLEFSGIPGILSFIQDRKAFFSYRISSVNWLILKGSYQEQLEKMIPNT